MMDIIICVGIALVFWVLPIIIVDKWSNKPYELTEEDKIIRDFIFKKYIEDETKI